MTLFKENMSPMIQGFVEIYDITNEDDIRLLEKKNAIHFENMSIALANSLANNSDGNIHEMHFGNGGATVNGVGAITYFSPNTSGLTANLYNPTYFKVVDDNSPLNLDPTLNKIDVKHISNTVYSDVVITCTLDFNEPSGQEAFDTATNAEGNFIFDEIGLKSFNTTPGAGKLLTHVIFSPIQKSLNRRIQIQYSIRIQMC